MNSRLVYLAFEKFLVENNKMSKSEIQNLSRFVGMPNEIESSKSKTVMNELLSFDI